MTPSRSFLSGSLLPVCAAVLLMLTGCAALGPVTPAPVSTPEDAETDTSAEGNAVEEVEPPAPPNPEILRALSQLADIRDELKQIRNSVEELQFESNRDKRRRQDLYQDVDRRLLELERNQLEIILRLERAASPGVAPDVAVVTTETDSTEGVTAGSPPAVSQEPDESPAEPAVPDSDAAPDSDDFPVVDGSATVSLDEQNAYDEALGLLKQSRYQDFVVAAQQFVTNWPTSQLVDDIWYWIAEAHYVNREFENALNSFRTVVVRYPDSQRVPEALLKMGYIQYDIGAYNEAAEIFRDILARFPAHNVAISAQTRLRRIEQTIQ